LTNSSRDKSGGAGEAAGSAAEPPKIVIINKPATEIFRGNRFDHEQRSLLLFIERQYRMTTDPFLAQHVL
jgi:hypothetical protein